MSPQRFEIGQEITMANNKPWRKVAGSMPDNLPLFGKIYHVSSYVAFDHNWYLKLTEFPANEICYERRFSPVISTSELEHALSEITQPQEI